MPKPFVKNDPRINKTGRPKGKPNRSTVELRAMVQNFIDDNMEALQADFDALEPKDRLNFMERLLKHVLPAPLNELERLTPDQLDDLYDRLKQDMETNIRRNTA